MLNRILSKFTPGSLAAEKHVSRGRDHLKKGQKDAALAAFNEAILLDPHNSTAYLNRAQVWLEKKTINSPKQTLPKL